MQKFAISLGMTLFLGFMSLSWADPAYNPNRPGDLPLDQQEVDTYKENYRKTNREINSHIDKQIENERRASDGFIKYLKQMKEQAVEACYRNNEEDGSQRCDPDEVNRYFKEEIRKAEADRDRKIRELEQNKMSDAEADKLTEQGYLRTTTGSPVQMPAQVRAILSAPPGTPVYGMNPAQQRQMMHDMYNHIYAEATKDATEEERRQMAPAHQRHHQMLDAYMQQAGSYENLMQNRGMLPVNGGSMPMSPQQIQQLQQMYGDNPERIFQVPMGQMPMGGY